MAELWGLEGSVSFFMRRTVHNDFYEFWPHSLRVLHS